MQRAQNFTPPLRIYPAFPQLYATLPESTPPRIRPPPPPTLHFSDNHMQRSHNLPCSRLLRSPFPRL